MSQTTLAAGIKCSHPLQAGNEQRKNGGWGGLLSLCFNMELKQRRSSHMTCCVQLDVILERCTVGLTCLRRLFVDRKLDRGGVFHKIKLIFPSLFCFVVESGCCSFAVFVGVLLNLFVLAVCLLPFCLSFWRRVGSLAVAAAERL